eukprot:CAMPEP_0202916356 /NCGR_PEP_ID=MMETSP1392-20130828/68384_1 /ASSEMBLY_ACC=CAM_ASM_000868 /TAXON_ID=225041 /ORGANISM="Chlamydomonas chlamydogama, Strain SAG 11-48b" /LENGTH=435 /DNA_ID=CAMNT_0049608763 /DNA_START=20 /DNA_END=1327 /DNA_ORIENTATION=+
MSTPGQQAAAPDRTAAHSAAHVQRPPREGGLAAGFFTRAVSTRSSAAAAATASGTSAAPAAAMQRVPTSAQAAYPASAAGLPVQQADAVDAPLHLPPLLNQRLRGVDGRGASGQQGEHEDEEETQRRARRRRLNSEPARGVHSDNDSLPGLVDSEDETESSEDDDGDVPSMADPLIAMASAATQALQQQGGVMHPLAAMLQRAAAASDVSQVVLVTVQAGPAVQQPFGMQLTTAGPFHQYSAQAPAAAQASGAVPQPAQADQATRSADAQASRSSNVHTPHTPASDAAAADAAVTVCEPTRGRSSGAIMTATTSSETMHFSTPRASRQADARRSEDISPGAQVVSREYVSGTPRAPRHGSRQRARVPGAHHHQGWLPRHGLFGAMVSVVSLPWRIAAFGLHGVLRLLWGGNRQNTQQRQHGQRNAGGATRQEGQS